MKSALEQALDCLSRRALTRSELEKRLRDKDYPETQIVEALQRIITWGYIDDQRVALDFCQTRQSRYSRYRIRQDLRSRGIEDQVIAEVLNTYSVEEEFKQCARLAEQLWDAENVKLERESLRSKNKLVKTPKKIQLQQRVGRKLVHRGYPYYMIHGILQQLEGKEE